MLVATQRKRNADCAPFHRLALKVPSTEQLMYRPLDPLDQQHIYIYIMSPVLRFVGKRDLTPTLGKFGKPFQHISAKFASFLSKLPHAHPRATQTLP